MTLESVALAWLAAVAAPGVDYVDLAPALALAGVAAAGSFAPIQSALLGAVKPEEQGQASGVAMVIRELGGVIGVAVLGTVFAATGAPRQRTGSWPGSAPRCSPARPSPRSGRSPPSRSQPLARARESWSSTAPVPGLTLQLRRFLDVTATHVIQRGPAASPLLEETIGECLRRVIARLAEREALVVRHEGYRATTASCLSRWTSRPARSSRPGRQGRPLRHLGAEP